MKKYEVIGIILMLLVVHTDVLFSQSVAEETQAQMVFKVLPYDRNFDRFGDPIRIGATSTHMLKALQKEAPPMLKGKKIVLEILNSQEDIPNFKIIFVDRNWSKNYATACAKATESQILMFCGSYNAVEKDEAAIAFRELQNKIRIVLNLKVMKNQGTEFPSDLLKLSLVVGSQ